MFKNFNWKNYLIRVVCSWLILAFILGFVSGIKGHAEDRTWILLFKLPDPETLYYYQKDSMMISPSGSPIITLKIVTEDFGTIYATWEFDCKNKRTRRIKIGKSLETMLKVDTDWEIPSENSVLGRLFKPVCSNWR
jgi:hypothetical protein